MKIGQMGNPLVYTVSHSQRHLFNDNPDTNHNANPTNPNGNCM